MKEDWKECKLGDVVEINQNSFSEKIAEKFENLEPYWIFSADTKR